MKDDQPSAQSSVDKTTVEFDTTSLPERSLFGQVMLWMLLPLMLIWPLGVALTYPIAQAIADRPFDRTLEVESIALAQQTRSHFHEPGVLLSSAHSIVREDEIDEVIFQVRGPDMNILIGDARLPRLPYPDFPELSEAPQPNFSQTTLGGKDFRLVTTWINIAPPDQPVALALIQIAETTNKRRDLARNILRGVSIPQLIVLPVAVFLVWLGLVRGISPLTRLQERLRKRRSDDFSPIDPNAAPTEMRVLVNSFNDLLARLDAGQVAHRNFIANAAHQLKTPLAGLRAQVELALRGQHNAEPVQVKHSLEQIAKGSERATRVVQQLLALAKVEDPLRSQQEQLIDLSQLAAQVVAQWFEIATHRSHDLGYEGPDTQSEDSYVEDPESPLTANASAKPRVQIMGQPGLITELISNLVDNAIRYTPPGGHITVRVVGTLDQALLQVEDNGPGVPTAERNAVFDRFYRILGNDQDGSGLGLAIVREIANAHTASVTLSAPNTPATSATLQHGSGLIVTVAFPRTNTDATSDQWQPSIEP